jgi:ferredoxin--NADP+ reductase
MKAVIMSPRRLRVAVVGSGPAGFYAAHALLDGGEPAIEVDMIERLPAPFGLVRSGVAPDHQRIKRAAEAFEKIAAHPCYRFLGNVWVGRDVTVEELLSLYDLVVIATGSSSDRRLGIPGEDLAGSHAATSFVGWYNSHPDFRDEHFDLVVERAVIVGMGNVALDVARMLVRPPDELASTDIASHALTALQRSRIQEVVLLGRRGPRQAAFGLRELHMLAEARGVELVVDQDLLAHALSDPRSSDAERLKIQAMLTLSRARHGLGRRRVRLEFLASPVEFCGTEGRLTSVRVERNTLIEGEDGRIAAQGNGQYESFDCGLAFRSIGYRGVPIPGLPFDARTGTIPSLDGRVTDGVGGPVLPRLYVTGWIKRGAIGVIGTNKPDAQATADNMLADLAAHPTADDPHRDHAAVLELLAQRGVAFTTFPDWQAIDAAERSLGTKLSKVREKFGRVSEMLDAADAAGRAQDLGAGAARDASSRSR